MLYLLHKIRKRLSDIAGRKFFFKLCTENIYWKRKPNIFREISFSKKVNLILEIQGKFFKTPNVFNNLPENTIIVTITMSLYPNILYRDGSSALKDALDSRTVKLIPRENLIKITEFVLRNNHLKINNMGFLVNIRNFYR